MHLNFDWRKMKKAMNVKTKKVYSAFICDYENVEEIVANLPDEFDSSRFHDSPNEGFWVLIRGKRLIFETKMGFSKKYVIIE